MLKIPANRWERCGRLKPLASGYVHRLRYRTQKELWGGPPASGEDEARARVSSPGTKCAKPTLIWDSKPRTSLHDASAGDWLRFLVVFLHSVPSLVWITATATVFNLTPVRAAPAQEDQVQAVPLQRGPKVPDCTHPSFVGGEAATLLLWVS